MVRFINTEIPSAVSRKPSAGRNKSELKAAVWRLSHHDKNVTDLTMSWALIADEGCRVLAASLAHNTVLTKLDLHYNDITPIGATALAHTLKVNTTLTSLDLSYNSAGDPGAYAFCRALRENSTLINLDLSANHVSAPMMASLKVQLAENRDEPANGHVQDGQDPAQRNPRISSSVQAGLGFRFQEAFVTTLFPPVERRRARLLTNKYSMDLV